MNKSFYYIVGGVVLFLLVLILALTGYLRDIWTRVKIDWQEWRGYQTSVWNVKRDKKQIERSIRRAKIKNLSDGKTYFVLRNLVGGFDEVTWEQAKLLKRKKIRHFPLYQDYYIMLTKCFAIVTSNEVQRKSYVEAVRNIQNDELNSIKNDKERQKNH